MTSSRQYRCVLFDLDGTLADTAPDMVGALNAVRAQEDLAPLPVADLRDYVSHGSGYLVRMAFGVDQPESGYRRRLKAFLAHYREHLSDATTLFPGMSALLDGIERAGCAWGVVTNKPAWLTDPLMAALALDQRAHSIVSGDTTAERKPHPLPMLFAATQARTAPSACLYVGDAERDIQAGAAAGMTTLIAGYGYIDAAQQPERWGADGQIEHPAQVWPWLDQSQW
ncbi:MAG: HAD family hydrolase [Thiotrichales bacterium]